MKKFALIWALILVTGIFSGAAGAHIHLDTTHTQCEVCLLPNISAAITTTGLEICLAPQGRQLTTQITRSAVLKPFAHHSRAPPVS